MKSFYLIFIFGAVAVLAGDSSSSEEDNGFFMGGKKPGSKFSMMDLMPNKMFPSFDKNPLMDISQVQKGIKKFMTDLQDTAKKFGDAFTGIKKEMEDGQKGMVNDINNFVKQTQADMDDAKNQLVAKANEMEADTKKIQQCLEDLQKTMQKNMEASAKQVYDDCLEVDPAEQVANMNDNLKKFFDSVSTASTQGQLLGQIMMKCLGSGDFFCAASQEAFKKNLKDLDAQGRKQLKDMQNEMAKQQKKMEFCRDNFMKTQSGGQKDFFAEAEKCFAKNVADNPFGKL